MNIEMFKIALEGLLVAIGIDIVFGEPRGFFHIAVISGKLSEKIEKKIGKKHRGSLAGFFLLLIAILSITIPLMILFDILYAYDFLFLIFILLFAIFLKSTFALTSMGRHIRPIINSLEQNDLEGARFHLSMCVRRPTANMERGAICSAAIETVAEGITDSFTGALFMYSIFGIAGAIIYRIVNTMDSMFGYRDSKYLHFGRPSAVADTILNYIPARISAVLIYVSAYLLNLNMKKTNLRSVLYSLSSRNAAYSMGSMAVVLNVRLEKKGKYIINRNGFSPDVNEIKRSLNIFYLSFFIMTIFITIPILLIMSVLIWVHIPFIYFFKIYL